MEVQWRNQISASVSVMFLHSPSLSFCLLLSPSLSSSCLRTLEFLMRHLVKMSTFSSETNMHARNLAIVWAPNLLRCVCSTLTTRSWDHPKHFPDKSQKLLHLWNCQIHSLFFHSMVVCIYWIKAVVRKKNYIRFIHILATSTEFHSYPTSHFIRSQPLHHKMTVKGSLLYPHYQTWDFSQ